VFLVTGNHAVLRKVGRSCGVLKHLSLDIIEMNVHCNSVVTPTYSYNRGINNWLCYVYTIGTQSCGAVADG
jgi:hypothetical protein